MSLKKRFSRFLLKCAGWKAVALTPDYNKCVLVVAPHTSNWDFIVGKLAYNALGRQGHFLIKKEWFRFPFKFFFKSIGGIPVDRGKKNQRMTDTIIDLYSKYDHFSLGITPEGTRKPNAKWKRGFYHIALGAKVPIVLVKLDYGNKCASLFQVFHPSGDEEADILAIKEAYRGVRAKNPKQFLID